MSRKASTSDTEFPFARLLVDRAPNPAPQAIAEVERAAGAPFPQDYRRFLLTYNGGNCDEWLMIAPDTVVAFFYGVREDRDSLSLADAIEWGQEPEEVNPFTGEPVADPAPRLPRETIPIAEGPDGHVRFCLVLTGRSAGTVWLCDSGSEPAPGYDGTLATAGHMERVAGSFAAFLKSLKPYEIAPPKAAGPEFALASDNRAALAKYIDTEMARDRREERFGTLSYMACQYNAPGCLGLLIERGLPARTALEHACTWGREEIVRDLIAKGEKPRLFHRSAAAAGKHTAVLRLLDEAMARPGGD